MAERVISMIHHLSLAAYVRLHTKWMMETFVMTAVSSGSGKLYYYDQMLHVVDVVV